MIEIGIATGLLLFTAFGVFIGFRKFKEFIKKENKQSIYNAVDEAVRDEREKQEMKRRIELLEQKQEFQNSDISKELKRMNLNIEKLFQKQEEHLEKFHSLNKSQE
jgi:hypothetical protein